MMLHVGTYDIQSVTVSYNHQQSCVWVMCSFMSGSVAVGCAAKMILQNKTASEFTLRVLRSSPSEQEISECANHLDAGRYQMEVFDMEESGVLGSTAAVVICVSMPQPSQVMSCECECVSTKYTYSFLSSNLATPLSTDQLDTLVCPSYIMIIGTHHQIPHIHNMTSNFTFPCTQAPHKVCII